MKGGTSGEGYRRRLRPLPPGYLMPDIVYNQDSREFERGGMSLDEMARLDGRAELLLVIGTSLKTDGVARLVRSLANSVHRSGGSVVYIDQARPPTSRWNPYLDLHLQTDIDAWAVDAFKHLAPVLHAEPQSSSHTSRIPTSTNTSREVMPFTSPQTIALNGYT